MASPGWDFSLRVSSGLRSADGQLHTSTSAEISRLPPLLKPRAYGNMRAAVWRPRIVDTEAGHDSTRGDFIHSESTIALGAVRLVQSILLAIVVTLGVSVATLGSGASPAGADGVLPAFTSAATVTAFTGSPMSFTVTTTVSPTPALSITGALPATFTFQDNGDGSATITADPASNAVVAEYGPVTLTATNTAGAVTQSLTPIIRAPLAIQGTTNFRIADGDPIDAGWDADVSAFCRSQLDRVRHAAGRLDVCRRWPRQRRSRRHEPTDGSQDGVYPITITADDGLEPDVTLAVTLTVEPPSTVSFTNAASTTAVVGVPFSFTVTTDGAPTESFFDSTLRGGPFGPSPFPPGVSFTQGGNGTATISGIPQTPELYVAKLTTFYPTSQRPNGDADLHAQCHSAGSGLLQQCSFD